MSYVEVYGDIASQRKQIAEQRSQLTKPVVGGTAKQRRIAIRRLRHVPEYRKYIQAKKEQLSALKTAETELSEHESKVKEYERKGYKVKKADKGLQFSKTVKRKKRKRTTDSIPTPTARDITGASKQRSKTSPLPVGTRSTSKSDLMPTKEKPKPRDKTVIETATEYQTTPELDFLLKHSNIKERKELAEAIKQGPITVPEGTMGPVHEPIYPAITEAYESLTPIEKIDYAKEFYMFGDEGKSWKEIKQDQPDWELKIKDDKIVVATPLTDTGTLFTVMEKEYKKSPGISGFLRAGAIAYTSWFRPGTWREGFKGMIEGGGVLTGGMLGVQPRIGYRGAVETLKWEYGITKVEDPLMKWVKVQQPAYENVVLPFVGGAVLGKAGKIFQGVKHIWSPGTKIVLGGTKVVVAGAMSTVIGADIGYTAAMEQKGQLSSGTFATKLGKYTVQFAFLGAGYKWATIYKPTVAYRPAGDDVLQAQKFLTTFRSKPIIQYGKPSYVARGIGGYQKVIPTSILASEAKANIFKVYTPSTYESAIPIYKSIDPRLSFTSKALGPRNLGDPRFSYDYIDTDISLLKGTAFSDFTKYFKTKVSETGVPWYAEKPWYAKQSSPLKPIETAFPEYTTPNGKLKPMLETKLETNLKRSLAVDTRPNIITWTEIYTRANIKAKTLVASQTSILTKTQVQTGVRTKVFTYPFVSFQTSTLTKTQVQTVIQSLTLPKTQTLMKTQPLTLPKTQTLTKTQPLTSPKIQTKTLPKIQIGIKTLTLQNISKQPPVVDLTDFEGKTKKHRKKQRDSLGKGYRFRSWKVPTLKKLIGLRM